MSETDSDPDVPALAGEAAEVAEANGEVGDGIAPGHGPVRERHFSDNVRKLFAAAGAKLKAQIEDGADDLEPAISAPPPEPGTPDDDAKTPPPEPKPTDAPPASPAPTLPDAGASERQRATLDLREKTAAERETALEAREAALAARETARDRYLESPGATIRDLIKEWTGATTDDEVRIEVGDLIAELSETGLGMSLPPDIKTALESRRVLKAVKAGQARLSKQQAELEAKAKAAADDAATQQLRGLLIGKLEAAKATYPWLMVQDDPAGVVWDYILHINKTTGAPPPWDQAAKQADEYFKSNDGAFYDKRRHLLTPTPAKPESSAVASAPQGGAQSHAPSTLTNRTTTPVAGSPSSDSELTGEERRRRSLAKMRGALS